MTDSNARNGKAVSSGRRNDTILSLVDGTIV